MLLCGRHSMETTYVRQVWIKSSQALMRYELQVHNPGYAKTRTHTPYPTSSTTGSPARIGLIRMRGATSQLCSRVRRTGRDHDGDLENHQAARSAVGRTAVQPQKIFPSAHMACCVSTPGTSRTLL